MVGPCQFWWGGIDAINVNKGYYYEQILVYWYLGRDWMVELEQMFSMCKGKMDTVSSVFYEQRSDNAHTMGNWPKLPFPFGSLHWLNSWNSSGLSIPHIVRMDWLFSLYRILLVFGGNRREWSGKENLCKHVRLLLLPKNSKLETRDSHIKNVERCLDFYFLKGI